MNSRMNSFHIWMWFAGVGLLLNPVRLIAETKPQPTTETRTDKQADDGKSETTSAAQVDEKLISQWIAQLESKNFPAQLQAHKQLLQAGSSAIPQLKQSAMKGSNAIATRCVEILKQLHRSQEAEVKTKSEAALRELAKSENAIVAQRAEQAFDQEKRKKAQELQKLQRANAVRQLGNGRILINNLFPKAIAVPKAGDKRTFNIVENGKKYEIEEIIGTQISIKVTETIKGKEKTTGYVVKSPSELKKRFPTMYELYQKEVRKQSEARRKAAQNLVRAQIQFQVNNQALPVQGGGNRISIATKVVNGQRTIDVNENGRKIKIEDTNGTDINVQVTEDINGKQETKTTKAKDAKELEKKHPDIYKIYQQYTKNNRIRIGNAVPFGPAFPKRLLPFQQQLPVQPVRPKNAEQIENVDQQAFRQALKKFQKAQERLQQHSAQEKPDIQTLKTLSKALNDAARELEQAARKMVPEKAKG